MKNSCAYAFASSDWTWCITASEFWPSILNEDVARARRVVASRGSEEWNRLAGLSKNLVSATIQTFRLNADTTFRIRTDGNENETAPPPLDRDEKRLPPLAHARHGRHRFGRTGVGARVISRDGG